MHTQATPVQAVATWRGGSPWTSPPGGSEEAKAYIKLRAGMTQLW